MSGASEETPKQAARRLAAGALRDGYKSDALHEYRDAQGITIFWRIRCKHPVSGEKWIRPMHRIGHRFAIGEPAPPPQGKPLYRLADLLQAQPGDTIWIVEGEPCADALAHLGVHATTTGGGESANTADWQPLAGRPCVIWPDNDGPGAKYAVTVAERLRALGCAVDVLDVLALALPDKGDCVDWLAIHPEATSIDLLNLPRANKQTLDIATVALDGLAPTDSDRDSRDSRDTAPGKALGSPGEMEGGRDSRDNDPCARFEVFNGLPGYRDGVHWIGVEKDKDSGAAREQAPAWICSPLTVAATTRDGTGSEWGRLLVFDDRDGREHRWAMPMAMMAGSGEELRGELLRQGLEITSDGLRRRKLLDYIQSERVATAARCVTRTGWHGDAFVLPAATYGDTAAEPVIFQTAAPDGIALAQGGTLEGWREHVATPCVGNSRLVLALSAGFAGPCLGLAGAEGGGIHLRGGSSGGKSTALNVAASVFGPPTFARTWRQTDNALEGVASLHSDLLLILDEIGQLDAKHAGACAYLLANGQGKGRARRDGAPRAAASFRVLFLSAGEIGLGELVMQGGGKVRAGQEVRVVDIPADAGRGFGLFDQVPQGVAPGVFADRLKAAAAKHYGHALPAFLSQLSDDVEGARAAIKDMRDALAEELADGITDGQVRRVAQRFALIAAAGELASSYGLTGWPPEEAERAVRACFRDWLNARGTKGNAEPAAMLAQVRGFLEAHGEARFTAWDADANGQRTVNRAGYRRRTAAGPEYFVDREVFKREMAAGFDAGALARVLADCGALVTETGGGTTRKERLPDGRSVRVYKISPAIWEVEL